MWVATFLFAVFLRAAWHDPLTLLVWGCLLFAYLLANFILSCRHPNSFRRKFVIASWEEPREPVLLIREEVDIEPLEALVESHNAQYPDHKITLTAIFARALGEALSRTGRTYGKVAFGQFVPLASVDISVAVDIGGQNIANLVLRGCNTNPITQLSSQMRANVKPLKENKDPKFNKQVNTFRFLPSFVMDGFFRFLIFLNYDLGIPLPCLHMPANGFGAAILTNVSAWQIRDTFAPLIPTLRTVCTALMNQPVQRAVVRDGKVVVRRVMYFNTAFDHRFADGSDADKMTRALHEVFEDPKKYLWEAGFQPLT